MLNDASRNTFKKVYIACGFTDLRYGSTGLATLVKCRYHLDPYDKGTLLIFCGRRTDRIKALFSEEPEVRGAHDLIMYNYGPDKDYASVHLEVPDTMTTREFDKLTRKLERKILKKTGVVLAGVGLYSYNTGSDEAADIQKDVRERVMVHDWAVQLHGFYVDTETKDMNFDVVMSFDIRPREGLQIIYDEIKAAYPQYDIQISPDVDVSD